MRKILHELSKRKALVIDERKANMLADYERDEDRIFLNNKSRSRLNYAPLAVASPDPLSPRAMFANGKATAQEWQPLEARDYLRTEVRNKKSAMHLEQTIQHAVMVPAADSENFMQQIVSKLSPED